jgi:hypothetical protein
MKPRARKTIALFLGMLVIGLIIYFFSVERGFLVRDIDISTANPCTANSLDC